MATDALWPLRVALPTARAAVEAAIPARAGTARRKTEADTAGAVDHRPGVIATQRGDAAAAEHVPLALISERDGIAVRVLRALDVSPGAVQARLLESMEEG